MSIKMALQKLKQADLCALFGVVDRTIMRWCDEGLPRHGEGRGHYYIWAEVLPWYLDRVVGAKGESGDLTDKERKLKAEADLAEMEAAQMKGTLIPAAIVADRWMKVANVVKTRVLSIHTAARQRLHHLTAED